MTTPLLSRDPAEAKEFFEAKMAFTTGPVELERMMKNKEVNVVDVRAAEDYSKGHIPGALNLPRSVVHDERLAQRQDQRIVLLFDRLPFGCYRRRGVCRPWLSCHGVGWGVALVEG